MYGSTARLIYPALIDLGRTGRSNVKTNVLVAMVLLFLLTIILRTSVTPSFLRLFNISLSLHSGNSLERITPLQVLNDL